MLRDLKRNEVTAGTQCEPNQTLPVQLSSTDCSLASSKCRRPGNGKQVSELTPLRFNLRRKTHLREADEHRLAAFGRRFLSQQRLLWKCLSTSATCHCNRRYLTDAPLFKGRITFVRLMTPAAHADRSRYSSQDLSGFFFFYTSVDVDSWICHRPIYCVGAHELCLYRMTSLLCETSVTWLEIVPRTFWNISSGVELTAPRQKYPRGYTPQVSKTMISGFHRDCTSTNIPS